MCCTWMLYGYNTHMHRQSGLPMEVFSTFLSSIKKVQKGSKKGEGEKSSLLYNKAVDTRKMIHTMERGGGGVTNVK